ncbi:MAG: adenosine deaminase [Deltaproteobacteria bacterium]|nr:adenosine deaminase [Deltaproteobacteria bacterium]
MAVQPPTPRTELHRHLDVSLRMTTLLELSQAKGLVGESTSLESFQEKLWLRRPMKDLAEVLAKFTLFQQVLERPEDLERVAFEAVEDCWAEGIRQVELRYSPSFVCEDGSLTWQESLEAFHRGLERALENLPEMRAGLLLIASRDYGPDSAAQTVELYLKNLHRVAGIDLAGNEAAFPPRLFTEAFRPVGAAKAKTPHQIHVTVHAGEAAGPESVWEALELLAAERIGHGIRAFEDPELVRHFLEKEICLEMCPTSNWVTRAVPSLAQHPLKQALEAGIAATISTDDPSIFGVSLDDEIQVARQAIGLSESQVQLSFEHAARSTFLPQQAPPTKIASPLPKES